MSVDSTLHNIHADHTSIMLICADDQSRRAVCYSKLYLEGLLCCKSGQ